MTVMNTVIQGGGTTPTGTKNITANGVYDVTDYASADVQVPTTAPAHYIEKTADGQGVLQNSASFINLNGVTGLGNYVLAYAYYGISFPANTSVDLSSLTTISGGSACYYTFSSCTNLTSVDLSGLTTISGGTSCQSMFSGCRQITNVDLSGLTTISGGSACNNMFSGCTGITSINLSNLTTISGDASCAAIFSGCTGLITAKINALNTMTKQITSIFAQMFPGCTHLESVEFGGLKSTTFASRKDQIAYLFNNQTGSQATNGTTVHFPSNFDPSDPNHTFDASTLTGYPTFGGSASYIHVAFDLPATE